MKILSWFQTLPFTLREKCPNTEFLLVRILPSSDGIGRDTPYLSILSPHPEKYRPDSHFSRSVREVKEFKRSYDEDKETIRVHVPFIRNRNNFQAFKKRVRYRVFQVAFRNFQNVRFFKFL